MTMRLLPFKANRLANIIAGVFERFGNTGENIKRIQGTREYPTISVIEKNSCEVRPTSDNSCKAIAQGCAFHWRLGGMTSVNFDVSPTIVVPHILQ
jgi:hypothetical protein